MHLADAKIPYIHHMVIVGHHTRPFVCFTDKNNSDQLSVNIQVITSHDGIISHANFRYHRNVIY